MADEQDTPKLQIDSDWKEEAQQEKDRLVEEEAAQKDEDPGALPSKPTIMHLINMLAMQATMMLGGARGPQGEPIQPDPEMARFHIDMLGVIEEKTAGNLSDEEAKTLKAVLVELRSMFVQLAQMATQPPPPPPPQS